MRQQHPPLLLERKRVASSCRMVAFLRETRLGLERKRFSLAVYTVRYGRLNFVVVIFSLTILWPVFIQEKQKSKFLFKREIDIDFPTMIEMN
jgi:hypothetical protein